MTKTKNYQLNQWDAADTIRREDFNADNAAIDAALAKKAEQTALNALQDSLASANSTVAALSAALGSGGKNCRTVYGSYTGTGTYGSDNPNSLTFDFTPVLVVISQSKYASLLVRGSGTAGSALSGTIVLTWTSRGVSWYTTSTENADRDQNNKSGTTYYYAALGM